MFFHSSASPPERPDDPAVRRANLKRIWPLFAAYKMRLTSLLALIVVSAAVGVVPAFLLKHVIQAISSHDDRALSLNAGGMIAVAIAT
jgi:ATP-binding cassette, subfamily B, bacterial